MNVYVVRAGDCLSGIALRLTGRASRWRDLAKLNQRVLPQGPHVIHPGQRLMLPLDWPEKCDKPCDKSLSQ